MPFVPNQDRPIPEGTRKSLSIPSPAPEPTKLADPEKPAQFKRRQRPALDVISLKNYRITPEEVIKLMFG